MKKVKRWEPEFVEFLQTFNMRPDDDGDFVLFQHYQQLQKTNQELIEALTDISNMCIGEQAMGYGLDSQAIGELIYKVTGKANPELNKVITNAKQVMGDSDE